VYAPPVKAPRGTFLSTAASGLVSASLRHVRDAEHLASPGAHQSLEQAYHLAGFGPECARKATLSERWLDQAIGHGFGDVGERVLELATALDQRAARYAPGSLGVTYPALASWDVSCRYERTGARSAGEVGAICEQARTAVDAIVLALWLDGRWPEGEALQ
jgi:hypothetical protein